MRASWLAVAALAVAMPALGDPGPVLQMDYSNPGLRPAHWVLTLNPDGTGHFRSERGNAPSDPAEGLEAANVDRDIKVSAQFAGRVFQVAHQYNLFHSACDSHMKVAFQGWKKLSYSGPDGSGQCTWLGESLVAVASTIVEGARLENLLQHDPLGLDREMGFLMEATADGRIQQICSIQGILERLADDPAVMDRVRKRARTLMARTD